MRFRARILGAAAGGGLPQWNCGCPNCNLARAGPIPSQTQSSLAVTGDGTNWAALNASPDIRLQLSQAQSLSPTGLRQLPLSSVLVTTPQAVAQMDSLKAGRFCRERGLPIIGAVENMAGVVCPHCAGEFHVFPDAGLTEALAALEIRRIAQIPRAPDLAIGSDSGAPVGTAHPEGVSARAFGPLFDAVAALGRAEFGDAVARSLEDVFGKNLADDEMTAALDALPDDARVALTDQIGVLLEKEAKRIHEATEPRETP